MGGVSEGQRERGVREGQGEREVREGQRERDNIYNVLPKFLRTMEFRLIIGRIPSDLPF